MANAFDKFDPPKDNPFDKFDVKPSETDSGKKYKDIVGAKKPAESAKGEGFASLANNVGMGALNSASNIGANVLWPLDAAGVTGMSHDQRKAALNDFYKEHANPDSIGFKGGKLATDIAGTAGVGGVLAKGASFIPSLAEYAPALASSGFNLGKAATENTAKNLLIRASAGAANGGAVGAMLDPEHIGSNAALGAAIPVGAIGANKLGGFIKDAATSLTDPFTQAGKDKIISNYLNGLVGGEAPNVVNNLRSATAKTPGFEPTVGQAANNANLATLGRVMTQSHPQVFSQVAGNQNQALVNAVRGLGGDDLALQALTEARDKAVSPLYDAAKNIKVVSNPEIDALLSRPALQEAARNAASNMENKGGKFVLGESINMPQAGTDLHINQNIPLDAYVTQNPSELVSGGQGKTLLQQIQKMGGINQSHLQDITGEKLASKARAQVGLFNKSGKGIDDLASQLHDLGYVPHEAINDVDGGVQWLKDHIRDSLNGDKVYAIHDVPFSVKGDVIEHNPTVGQLPTYFDELKGHKVYSGDALQKVKFALDKMKNFQPMDAASNATRDGLLGASQDFNAMLADKVAPLREADAIYQDMSKPINRLQLGNAIADKYIPAQYRNMESVVNNGVPLTLNHNALAKIVEDNGDRLAKSVTGYKGSTLANTLSPEDIKALQGVVKDTQFIKQGELQGRGVNSSTYQNLSFDKALQKAGVGGQVMDAVSKLSPKHALAKKIGGFIYSGPNKSMSEQLALSMTDPKAVAGLLDSALMRNSSASKPTAMEEFIKQRGLLNIPISLSAQRGQ